MRKAQCLVRPEEVVKLIRLSYVIGYRTAGLPACGICLGHTISGAPFIYTTRQRGLPSVSENASVTEINHRNCSLDDILQILYLLLHYYKHDITHLTLQSLNKARFY
jgi:hypothetical protein